MSRNQQLDGAEERQIVSGPFVLTQRDFRQIARMLHEDAGISLSDAKATMVYSRLAKRLRSLGLKNFRDYCALLEGGDGADERQMMLAALTTNVTRFFREPHHFEHLKKVILAPRADAVRRGARLRIWSAACSDGQEPYSIAMSVLSVIPEANKLDVRILATDIDSNMVATGKAGVYNDDAVSAVPADMRSRWFSRVDGAGERGWRVGDNLAELVAFRELNLIGAWPMKGKFDVIFCRNVVIYFQEDTQHQIWSRFAPMLVDDGRLYIGHSERVSGPAASRFAGDGVTTYRLQGEKRS